MKQQRLFTEGRRKVNERKVNKHLPLRQRLKQNPSLQDASSYLTQFYFLLCVAVIFTTDGVVNDMVILRVEIKINIW